MLPLVLIVLGLISIRIALGNKILRLLSNSKFLGFLGILCIIIGFIGIWRPDPFKDFVRSNLLIDPSQVLLLLIILFSTYYLYQVWYEEPEGPSSSPPPQPSKESSRSLPKYGWLLVLGFAVIAVLEPYLPSLFSRMTGMETPWFKAQFAQKAERPILEVKRKSIPIGFWFKILPAVPDKIDKDIAFLKLKLYALEAARKGTQQSKEEKDISEKIEDFMQLLNYFRCRLNPKIKEINEQWESLGKGDMDLVREQVRPLLKELVTIQKGDKKELQKLKLKDLLDKPKKEPFEEELLKTCQEYNFAWIGRITNAPQFYLVLGLLYNFVGNSEDAINTFRTAVQRDYIGIHYFLGLILYHLPSATKEEREQAIKHLEEALKIAIDSKKDITKNYERAIEEFTKGKSTGKVQEVQDHRNHHEKNLQKRFEDVILNFKNNIAYYSAIEGIQEPTARRYAKEIYKNNPLDPALIDTYGYVKLRFAKNREEILEALSLFEEAEFKAKILDDNEEKRNSLSEIRLHYEQAEQTLHWK